MPTEAELLLLPLLKERCYKKGNFTLASGAKSDHYFDGKMIQFSSQGVSLIGEIIYDRTCNLPIDAIGGLEIGAVPLTTAAVYAYHERQRTMEGFFVRQKAKDHGTRKIIEGRLQPGSKVAIVDDVVTSGESVMQAIRAVRLAECEPVLALVLVDRLGGAAELFKREGIPYQAVFTIKDFQN